MTEGGGSLVPTLWATASIVLSVLAGQGLFVKYDCFLGGVPMASFLSLVSVSLVPSAVPLGMGCSRTGAVCCVGPPLVAVVVGPLLVVARLCGLILGQDPQRWLTL